MTRRNWMLSLCSSLLIPAGLLAQTAAPAATPTIPANRILIHVYSDKPADWQGAVTKANDYMSSAKPGTTLVEILATGDGLKLVDKDNPMQAEVMGSLNKDVSFVACHASMNAHHMGIDQLHSGVGTVPSGGKEMAQRKAEGWTMLEDKAPAK
jgi:intracellular sulfur oxidation DsrE/DsrF family protein